MPRRNSPNIAFQRPEYTDLMPRWERIKDCVAGEATIKLKKDTYLPRPNPDDKSTENQTRYDQYLARAVFYNTTARTLNGLVGQVVSEPAKIELPALLKPLEEDIDGGGVSLLQQSNKALALTVAHGRAGLMVDYPRVEKAATRAELVAKKVRPTVTLIEPWDIINWRVRVVGGEVKLSLVVIAEQYVTNDDGFEQTWDPQWRVLRLDEDNLYVIDEWIKDPDHQDEFIIKKLTDGQPATYYPVNSKNQRFDYIPFTFLGTTNNDPTPDLPPLYDLACLNVAHYRNSADYEEACYIVGQPTPHFGGLTEDWVKTVLKGRVELGSRAAVLLPEGGTAGLLQASENSMPKEAMEAKERQMVALGAKLVEQKTVQRTATEATMDKAAETSILASIAKNVSAGYTDALMFSLAFLDASSKEKILFELNTNFRSDGMTAQERAQLASEWMQGAITDEEYRSALSRVGVATEKFDDWNDKRETQLMSRPLMPLPEKKSDAEKAKTE